MNSDTTQEDQGRLTPRRAALAAALACLPVLVAAAELLAMIAKRRGSIGAHAFVLHKIGVPMSEHRSRNARERSSIERWQHNILLLVALGPILAMCWSCRVSVESRRAKSSVFSGANLGSLWLAYEQKAR
jgi:hypothetical protein